MGIMDKNPGDIEKRFKEKEDGEFRELFTRMDEDMERWDMVLSPSNFYENDIRDKTKWHASNICVVSNELRDFADSVHTILASSERQITVRMAQEEEDKREELGLLERLFIYLLAKGDERLARLLLPPLKDTLIWHGMIRGWKAGRFLLYKSGDGIVADFMPLDPRWLTYEVGDEGLLWVAYKTFRSSESLESEYSSYKENKNWLSSLFSQGSKQKDIPVIDYWLNEGPGKIGNAVVCNGQYLKEPEIFDIPSMPILIRPTAVRPPIASTSGIDLKGYGESIFAPARHIHAVRNRFFSIMATTANLLANQPLLNYTTDKGKPIPPGALFNVPGSVIELAKGEQEVVAPPMKEISATEVNMLSWLNGQMERVTLPKMGMERPPSSGTRFGLALEVASRVFNPQLRNLDGFYTDLCRLLEEQLLVGGIGEGKIKNVKIKGEKDNKYYEVKITPVDLKKPHIIEVKHTATNPWEQLGTAQLADMLIRQGVPEGWVWENIYKFQDPKGMQDLRAIELYEHSPIGAMKTAIEAMKRLGRDEEEIQSLLEVMNRIRLEEAGGEREAVPRMPTGEGRPPEVPPVEVGGEMMPPEMPATEMPAGIEGRL